ncbi:hypothetical protein [uncultured Sanguibacteroides sp.]|uniref:golvesin C-terminal-like domain-containing protein n=1 Tax=uncultured Sanguibacteroides sp. TaxID=1635151 RepID=UPI0025CC1C84|nr:hypothetical protein [uncultured Sanguibacteroides sp.]
MKFQIIKTIACYEAKLLRRNWGFRIFAVIALLGTWIFQYVEQIQFLFWFKIAMPSSLPWFNTYIYNVLQALMIIFVVTDVLKRDRRFDSGIVLTVYPVSNSELILGKMWGIASVFIGLNFISLLLAASMNIFLSLSPFNLWLYFFYFLTLSLPALIFMTGFSFFVSRLVKEHIFSLLLLLLFWGVTYWYLPEICGGAFDFFAIGIPNLFSTITGHPELSLYLLQRASFVGIGLGMLLLAALWYRRLTDGKELKRLRYLSCTLLTVGIICMLGYSYSFLHEKSVRKRYADTYVKYADKLDLRVEKSSIVYRQEGNHIFASVQLQVKNIGEIRMQELLLYLNPGLEVRQLSDKGKNLAFYRDNQVIVVEKELQPGESTTVQIEYDGKIDERICYLDIPDKEYADTRWNNDVWRFGKRNAFVEKGYTLLLPECLWYPGAVPPVNLRSLYATEKNFTTYDLRVFNPDHQMVISQGKVEESGDTVRFVPGNKLTGIALSIGPYEKKSITVDSVLLEWYYFKGSNLLIKETDDFSDFLIPFLQKHLKGYPFQHLKMVETPVTLASYVRNWKGGTENAQPELLFYPERGSKILAMSDYIEFSGEGAVNMIDGNEIISGPKADFMRFGLFLESSFLREYAMRRKLDMKRRLALYMRQEMISVLKSEAIPNEYSIQPLYSNYWGFMSSPDYPMMDRILQVMLRFQEDNATSSIVKMPLFLGMNEYQQAMVYLTSHSLEDALNDDTLPIGIMTEIINIKARDLKNRISTSVSYTDLHQFLSDFRSSYLFGEIDFKQFRQAFSDQFQVDILQWLPEWYEGRQTASLIIKDLGVDKVENGEVKGYRGRVRVYNPSETDGVLSVMERGGYIKHFMINRGEAKEIRFLLGKMPRVIYVNTNLSQNIPQTLHWVMNPTVKMVVVSDTSQGIFDMDKNYFLPEPDEIVIDNEDDGFQIDNVVSKRFIGKILKKKEYDIPLHITSNSWTPGIDESCYGGVVRSAYLKLGGGENNHVTWRANIQRAGVYELWVYVPTLPAFIYNGSLEGDCLQYYAVQNGEENDEFSINITKDQGWVYVGEYRLPKGENRVVLLDRAQSQVRFVADAIKWKYINE